MTDIYVPARGQRIPMPGAQPDWPADGQPIDPLSAYHRRLVADGDLVRKEPTKAAGKGDRK